MVWLKRMPYTSKYNIFILLKYMNWLFSFLQAISVYGILSADQLVLGLARQKSEGSATVPPSCAVNKIRNYFPSASYAGFKYPHI